MRMFPSRFNLVSLLVVTACSSGSSNSASNNMAAPDVAAVRQAIESANARFIQALKAGDIATAVGNYADDAVVMMPNDAAWRGRAAMIKGFTDFTSQMTLTAFKATTEDVIVSGDLAVESGAYEWTLQPKTGASVHDKGKYLTVWRHQADGSWRIIRDINNSDMPAKM